MRWTPGGESEDVEDRRGEGGARFGGGGMKLGLGLGGFILLAVLSLIFKRDFFALLDTGGTTVPQGESRPADPAEQKKVQFVSFVLDDVQRTWEKQFQASGRQYSHAKLVLFRESTRSGCGYAESQRGPFYCSEDQKVYIDLGFFEELKNRFGAPGDFAQAYVLAHEVGHHVQRQLGIESRVRSEQEAHPDRRNALSVRMELQADCLAGVWAKSTEQRQILEAGDVEEGLGAAAAVGDDRIQKGATGRVTPETWTHGSSRERVDWFKRGMSSGSLNACDTFSARSL